MRGRAMEITVQAVAVLAHRKASSACCGALLQAPPEGADHEYDCTQCGQPAQRVLGEPRAVAAGIED